jgi:hypothetical protein
MAQPARVLVPRWLILIAVVSAFLALTACGTPTSAPPQTDEPTTAVESTAIPSEPTTAPVDTAVPDAPPTEEVAPPSGVDPAVMEAIQGAVASRSQNLDMLAASLFPIISLPVAGGDQVVFHWEDAYGETIVACTGYMVVALLVDGTRQVQTASAGCAPTPVPTLITIYPGRGVNMTGEETTVIFGEIYDASVAEIRARTDVDEMPALIQEGGYLIELPLITTEIIVTAYDANGAEVYAGTPGE